MYVPSAQFSPQTRYIIVRATADPQNLSTALREIVSALDKDETISAVRSMDDVLNAPVAQPRFSSQLPRVSSLHSRCCSPRSVFTG